MIFFIALLENVILARYQETGIGRGATVSMAETASQTEEPGEPQLIEDELLIEEVSIDGMCGVY
jgi:mycofactocin precursor